MGSGREDRWCCVSVPEAVNFIEIAAVFFGGSTAGVFEAGAVPVFLGFEDLRGSQFLVAFAVFGSADSFLEDGNHLDGPHAGSFGEGNLEEIAGVWGGAGLEGVARAFDFAHGAHFRGKAPGFEKPGGPEPFVDARGFGHGECWWMVGLAFCWGVGGEPLMALRTTERTEKRFLGWVLDSGDGLLPERAGNDHRLLRFHGWEMWGLCVDLKKQEEGTTNLTNPTNLLMLVSSVWLLMRMRGVLLGSGWGTTDGTENH